MKPFQLLIKPAAGDCNLVCDYCFYRRTTPQLYPEETRHRMSVELMEHLVHDLMSYRFPETVFCWQGGEPTLMGLDFFAAVIEAQQKYGRPGQVVGNAFQTNGILINEDWARFFARYNVVVGLSLDGPRELHDHFRKNFAGEGTFDRVMAAVELFFRHRVTFNILCVVNRENQERAGELCRFFHAQGFNYLQFIPCLETDASGQPLPFSATPEGLARFFREAFFELKRFGYPALSERNLDAVLNLHLSGQAGLCTFDARCGNYLVVEYNGDVYPCDFFVEEKWRLGNVAEGGLGGFFSRSRMKTFAEKKAKRPAECRTCSWLKFCHGGCLKDRLPLRADGPGRTWFCESYQELFRQTEKDMQAWASEIKAEEQARQGFASGKKPGRNDPCPCGSGKKFKRCCGKEKADG